jgi:hypothetical protein
MNTTSFNKVLWAGSPVWWGGIITNIWEIFVASTEAEGGSSKDPPYGCLIFPIFLIFAPVWIPYVLVTNLTARCIVTRNEVSIRRGLVFKNLDSLQLGKIENIELRRSMGGTAIVLFRGAGSHVHFGRIARAKDLKILVERLREGEKE